MDYAEKEDKASISGSRPLLALLSLERVFAELPTLSHNIIDSMKLSDGSELKRMMASSDSLYRYPSVQKPTLKQLEDIAAKLGFEIEEKELKSYQEYIGNTVAGITQLDKYPEPVPEVKYPRTPGRRPQPEENPYNGWFVKTDIRGAPEGKLKGKTIAIKDSMAVAGVPWALGSKILDGYIPEYDATVVTRVLDAGCTIAGKANVENVCISGSSFTCVFGPVLNPHDKTRNAGGSSNGCAVLVATGEVDMAIGADTGGSIRLPSCWCGTVGLKPTFGLVPLTGSLAIEPTQDHIGPITKTIEDCALLLEVLAGYDELDGRQNPHIQSQEYTKMVSSDLTGMKIGILTEGFEEAEPDVESMVKDAAMKLKTCGASVDEVSVPMHKDAAIIWGAAGKIGIYHSMVDNAGAAVGIKGFQTTTLTDALSRGYKTKANDLPKGFKFISMLGRYMKENYNYHYYMKASNLFRTLKKAYDKALETYDVLVMPTIKFKAPKLPTKELPAAEYLKASLGHIQNTCPFNGSGHPALSINAGFSEGLPVGMQLVAKYWDEGSLLKAGRAVEVTRDAK